MCHEELELEARWPFPDEVTGSLQLRDRLMAAYADGMRRYHDVRHLTEVLDRLDELEARGVAFEPLTVRLAAWFHDAVYDGRPDDEERSARWAEEALTALGLPPDVVREVARLVRLTVQHDPRPDDVAGAALCDADLAVLAADADRYRAYADAVRQEHASLPDAVFRAGRGAVLRALLTRPRLFSTEQGFGAWESRARENVTAELAVLEDPAG